jgi:hypothetical protein
MASIWCAEHNASAFSSAVVKINFSYLSVFIVCFYTGMAIASKELKVFTCQSALSCNPPI